MLTRIANDMRIDGRQLVLIFLFATAAMTLSDPVDACSCGGTSVCQVVDQNLGKLGGPGVVFVGTVTEFKHPVTRFRVERVLVGAPAKEITLGPVAGLAAAVQTTKEITLASAAGLAASSPAAMISASDCAIGFKAGERYLVYAYRDMQTGDLYTSMCSRTRRMSDPEAQVDLTYFEARDAGGPTSGWLSGIVRELHYDSSRGPDGRVKEWIVSPLSGIRVTATSPTGETHTTVTRDGGVYVFTGLTLSWDWQVKADLPRPFQPHDGLVTARYHGPTPTVPWSKGTTCAEANIDARIDGVISGVILDEQGRPGRGIVVELGNAQSLRSDPDARADQEVVTDEQGRFEFRPLPAGTYVVGVQLEKPHMTDTLDRRRYHPGVRQLESATAIALNRGQRLQIEPFRLPALPEERTITVTLRAPTADVAAGTRVFLTGATKQRLDMTSGSISLRLPFNAAYVLSVEPPQGFLRDYARSSDPYRRNREHEISRDDTDRTIEIVVRPR